MISNPEIIEGKEGRIVLGIVAFLLLPILLFISIYGFTFGIGGFTEFNVLFILVGIVNFLGLIGYIAALYRLCKKHSELSITQASVLRKTLICGVLSGIFLLIGCFYAGMPLGFSVVCLLITATGLVFVYATPNKPLKQDS